MGYALLFVTILAVVVQNCLAADIDCKQRPVRVDPKTCCPTLDLISEEVKEKCKEFMMPPSPISGDMAYLVDPKRPPPSPPSAGQQNDPTHHGGPQGHMHACLMSCVLNETGILNGTDAKLNADKLTAYLNVVLKNSTNLIPMVETSFKTCLAKAEMFHEKMQKIKKNRPTRPTTASSTNVSKDRMMRPPRCPVFAGHLMGCVQLESIMNCPSRIWSNTTICNNMRDHIKQCKPMQGNSIEDINSNSTEDDM